MSLEAEVAAPLILTMLKYITAEGSTVPLRPVPPTTISYTHTDSTYSRMSQRSDFTPRLEEDNAEDESATRPSIDASAYAETSDPTTQGPDAQPSIPTITTTPERPQSLHVLVIDDDPLTRLLMARVGRYSHCHYLDFC